MKLSKIIISIALLCVNVPMMAQVTPQQEKEAAKEAKKEAKKLEKEGWKVPAGELSIEKQWAQTIIMRMEKDDEGQPKYVFGRAISGGDFYDAAKLQAIEVAKSELIGNISTDVTRLIDMKLQNKQKSARSATSMSEITAKGKSLMSQKLDTVIPVLEIYRTNPDNTVEIQLVIAYERRAGVNEILDSVNAELEDEGIR
ncbi:MAG: hypothetical protein IJ580_01180 [Prevotella sp.]|nr:hypothetical protein [Prevotella sp.]